MLYYVLLRHPFYLSNVTNIIYFLWLSIKINAGASTFLEQLFTNAKAQIQSLTNMFWYETSFALYEIYIWKYTMHTTVSWSDPIQWLIHHISGLMMMIKCTTILAIVRRELVRWKQTVPLITQKIMRTTHLRHTHDRLYRERILYAYK